MNNNRSRAVLQRRFSHTDIPLSVKLKAWWEGYDPSALYALIVQTEKAAQPHEVSEPRATGLHGYRERHDFKSAKWTEQRIAASQLVWGPARLEPTPAIQLDVLRRLLDVKQDRYLLSIGAGLGGFDRSITEKTDVKIDSYDTRQQIAAHGKTMISGAGLTTRSSVSHLDCTKHINFSRRYDGLLIVNSLGRIESLPKLFNNLAKSLRPGSKFLLMDWFRCPSKTHTELTKSLANEIDPHFVSMINASELIRMCHSEGFKVAENTLLTSETVEAITQPWRMIVDSLTALLHDMDRRDLADELVNEAEVWMSRISLAQTGHIECRMLSGTFTKS
jgi:cyclopropane fatty-acyl-phospholipid synthase-like methyltransferase